LTSSLLFNNYHCHEKNWYKISLIGNLHTICSVTSDRFAATAARYVEKHYYLIINNVHSCIIYTSLSTLLHVYNRYHLQNYLPCVRPQKHKDMSYIYMKYISINIISSLYNLYFILTSYCPVTTGVTRGY